MDFFLAVEPNISYLFRHILRFRYVLVGYAHVGCFGLIRSLTLGQSSVETLWQFVSDFLGVASLSKLLLSYQKIMN